MHKMDALCLGYKGNKYYTKMCSQRPTVISQGMMAKLNLLTQKCLPGNEDYAQSSIF